MGNDEEREVEVNRERGMVRQGRRKKNSYKTNRICYIEKEIHIYPL